MDKNQVKRSSWLTNSPSKTLHRLGTSMAGMWITSLIINAIWPLPDQVGDKKSLIIFELNNSNLSTETIQYQSQKRTLLGNRLTRLLNT